jgi:hypothetical protein
VTRHDNTGNLGSQVMTALGRERESLGVTRKWEKKKNNNNGKL